MLGDRISLFVDKGTVTRARFSEIRSWCDRLFDVTLREISRHLTGQTGRTEPSPFHSISATTLAFDDRPRGPPRRGFVIYRNGGSAIARTALDGSFVVAEKI